MKPDHKTISNFRKNNKECLRKALRRIVRVRVKLDLIEGNVLFLDGSKIRGNSSINQTKTLKKWKEKLADVDKRIDRIIEDAEKIDGEESGGLVKMDEELRDAEKLKRKIEAIIEKGEAENLTKVNGTDADAADFKSRQGGHSGFNAQVVADEKNGLIVSADVVDKNNDHSQFADQIDRANEVLEKNCEIAAADSGYFVVDDLKKIADREIDVVVPSQKRSSRKKDEAPFDKDKFEYDAESDEYRCPEGKILGFSYYSKAKEHFIYRMKREADCRECRHFGSCTKSKRGRTISRLKNEEFRIELAARYESAEGRKIYKKREEKVELPFGHIKRNLGGGAFLLRGLNAVKAEFSIYANRFNISRMITLLGGVWKTIEALRAFS